MQEIIDLIGSVDNIAVAVLVVLVVLQMRQMKEMIDHQNKLVDTLITLIHAQSEDLPEIRIVKQKPGEY